MIRQSRPGSTPPREARTCPFTFKTRANQSGPFRDEDGSEVLLDQRDDVGQGDTDDEPTCERHNIVPRLRVPNQGDKAGH